MGNSLYSLYWTLLESKKQAKIYLDQGKIDRDIFNKIQDIDPSPTKKYMGWLAKVYISGEETDFDNLRNTIKEFDNFVINKSNNKEQIDGINKETAFDITGYRSFEQLRAVLDKIGPVSSRGQLEGDFKVVADNENLRIVAPYTHEASKKLGITPMEKGGFAFRECEDGSKDSQWCTTHPDSRFFHKYFFKDGVELFYILIKGSKLQQQLKSAGFGPQHFVVALTRGSVDTTGKAVVTKNNQGQTVFWDNYDGYDKQLSPDKLQKWMSIVGVK